MLNAVKTKQVIFIKNVYQIKLAALAYKIINKAKNLGNHFWHKLITAILQHNCMLLNSKNQYANLALSYMKIKLDLISS